MKKQQFLHKILPIIIDILIVFIVSIGTQFLVTIIAYWMFGDKIKNQFWILIIDIIVYLLMAIFLIIILPKISKKFKTSKNALGIIDLPTWTDIGLAILGFVVALLLSNILTAIFSLFPWFNATEEQTLNLGPTLDGGIKILAFIALVIIAPIVEELIFRGWLYGNLRKKLRMPLAIFLTSLAFGIVHMQFNVGIVVFSLSLVMCFLRELTGTIYSGILVHMIKNGVAFYLLYVIGVA